MRPTPKNAVFTVYSVGSFTPFAERHACLSSEDNGLRRDTPTNKQHCRIGRYRSCKRVRHMLRWAKERHIRLTAVVDGVIVAKSW